MRAQRRQMRRSHIPEHLTQDGVYSLEQLVGHERFVGLNPELSLVEIAAPVSFYRPGENSVSEIDPSLRVVALALQLENYQGLDGKKRAVLGAPYFEIQLREESFERKYWYSRLKPAEFSARVGRHIDTLVDRGIIPVLNGTVRSGITEQSAKPMSNLCRMGPARGKIKNQGSSVLKPHEQEKRLFPNHNLYIEGLGTTVFASTTVGERGQMSADKYQLEANLAEWWKEKHVQQFDLEQATQRISRTELRRPERLGNQPYTRSARDFVWMTLCSNKHLEEVPFYVSRVDIPKQVFPSRSRNTGVTGYIIENELGKSDVFFAEITSLRNGVERPTVSSAEYQKHVTQFIRKLSDMATLDHPKIKVIFPWTRGNDAYVPEITNRKTRSRYRITRRFAGLPNGSRNVLLANRFLLPNEKPFSGRAAELYGAVNAYLRSKN